MDPDAPLPGGPVSAPDLLLPESGTLPHTKSLRDALFAVLPRVPGGETAGLAGPEEVYQRQRQGGVGQSGERDPARGEQPRVDGETRPGGDGEPLRLPLPERVEVLLGRLCRFDSRSPAQPRLQVRLRVLGRLHSFDNHSSNQSILFGHPPSHLPSHAYIFQSIQSHPRTQLVARTLIHTNQLHQKYSPLFPIATIHRHSPITLLLSFSQSCRSNTPLSLPNHNTVYSTNHSRPCQKTHNVYILYKQKTLIIF